MKANVANSVFVTGVSEEEPEHPKEVLVDVWFKETYARRVLKAGLTPELEAMSMVDMYYMVTNFRFYVWKNKRNRRVMYIGLIVASLMPIAALVFPNRTLMFGTLFLALVSASIVNFLIFRFEVKPLDLHVLDMVDRYLEVSRVIYGEDLTVGMDDLLSGSLEDQERAFAGRLRENIIVTLHRYSAKIERLRTDNLHLEAELLTRDKFEPIFMVGAFAGFNSKSDTVSG